MIWKFIFGMVAATLAGPLLAHDAGHTPVDPAASGAADRAYWVGVLDRLANPVLTAAANHELKKRMPIESSSPRSEREKFTHLEAVGRLLAGIAPWLELEDPAQANSAEARLRDRYRRLAVQTIDSITDPASPDYCNFRGGETRMDAQGRIIDERQPLVDAAFLAQALLRAPTQLWGRLSPAAQARVIAAFQSVRTIKAHESNWLLFSATVEAALARFGGEGKWSREPIEYALKRHDQWYVGDGTYGDGPQFRWDYYNSFVIHPMLLDVSTSMAGHGPWPEDLFERLRERARRYAVVQERLISPEGALPPIGRSLAYRFAALQTLGMVALRHELPEKVTPAQVRCGMTAVIRRMIEAPGTFDAEGWLRIGFCGSQPAIGEGYIATGSLYLCSVGLVPLGLPAADEFWNAPASDWTARRIYRGLEVPNDHALFDEVKR